MEDKLTFEQAMTRLEQIVAKLESGKCSLDESIRLFEEGTRLTGFCRQSLDTAEQKIRRLTDTAAVEE
ncbi:MAG: exodeoxyribonuclease VII small subunit [Clostridia bacterium]|nr:exodeoxyribonuclease VII small subunit [Clostridia bacterium]MBQ2939498.1 exodeoxyribonuclease VII small subunit [Clostridia bacterium]